MDSQGTWNMIVHYKEENHIPPHLDEMLILEFVKLDKA